MNKKIEKCCDCQADIGSHGKVQYYLVYDKIWKTAMQKGKAMFLCVECLEKRIERNITSDDFPLCILNYRAMFHRGTSDKLKIRLGKRFSSSKEFKEIITKEWDLFKIRRRKQYELHKEVYERSIKRDQILADSGEQD